MNRERPDNSLVPITIDREFNGGDRRRVAAAKLRMPRGIEFVVLQLRYITCYPWCIDAGRGVGRFNKIPLEMRRPVATRTNLTRAFAFPAPNSDAVIFVIAGARSAICQHSMNRSISARWNEAATPRESHVMP